MVAQGKTAGAAELFDQMSKQAAAAGLSVDDLNKVMPEYRDALLGVSNAQRQNATGAKDMAGGLDTAKTAAAALKNANDDLKTSLDGSKSLFLQLRGAENGYEAAIDAATTAVKENGRTLDVHTEKGRANREALDGIASAGMRYAQSLIDQGVPAAQVQSQLENTRKALIAAAEKFGMGANEAKYYADRILAIPTAKATTITTNTAQAIANVNAVISRIAQINGKSVTINVTAAGFTTFNGVSTLKGFAGGGRIPGQRSSRDDRLTPVAGGEYVVNAASTDRFLPVLEAINSGSFRGGVLLLRHFL